jgi:hypothetical protein
MNKQNKHITQTTQMNKQQTHNTDYTDEQAEQTQSTDYTDQQTCYVFVVCSSVWSVLCVCFVCSSV